MPTDMKNRPISRPRNGSISASSWWRKLDSDSSRPGQEGAERHRHADRLHQHGGAEHDQQRCGGEDFAGAGARQQAKQRIERAMAGQNDEGQRGESFRQVDQRLVHRAGHRGGAAAEKRDGRQQRARRRCPAPAGRRRRAGHSLSARRRAPRVAAWRWPWRKRPAPRRSPTAPNALRPKSFQAAKPIGRAVIDHLAHAHEHDVAAHGAQPRRLERQADQEQQQHHAELGYVEGHARVGDQRRARRGR